MGNEVAVIRADETVAVSPFATGAGFDNAQRVAKALASSTLVPEAYRANLPNVLVAMELAHRIGASVFAVMQNTDVIHGRPSLRSTFKIATVNASGRFTPIRWRFQGTEGTDEWGCRAVATDVASGEECVGPLVSIALSKLEGWHGRNGSKWKNTPELMLMYRSADWWTRLYCPEYSLGMTSADEAEDIGPSRQAQAQAAAAALDAPDAIPEAEFTVEAPAGEPAPERTPGEDDGDAPEPGSDLFDAAVERAQARHRSAQGR